MPTPKPTKGTRRQSESENESTCQFLKPDVAVSPFLSHIDRRYQVFRTQKLDMGTAAVLRELEVSDVRFDFWKEARGGLSAEIMAAPGHVRNLTDLLDEVGVGYIRKIEDVQR